MHENFCHFSSFYLFHDIRNKKGRRVSEKADRGYDSKDLDQLAPQEVSEEQRTDENCQQNLDFIIYGFMDSQVLVGFGVVWGCWE